MSAISKTGLVLVVLGTIALLLAMIKFKSKQEILRIGEFRATTTSEKTFPELVYGGGALVLVGGVLLFTGSRRSGGR